MRVINRRHSTLRKILCVFICLVLSACSPSENTSIADVEIIQGEIGGKTYYVPKAYFKLQGRYFDDENIYLQMMYPEFMPLQKSAQKYWEEGQRFRNIRILANFYEKPAGIEKLTSTKINSLKAFKVVGEEYGLVHRTQPEGQNQDNLDLWIEEYEGAAISFVTCSKKLTIPSFPQCKLHYFLARFHITTSFDKRLLPEWRAIKDSMLALFASFESESAAKIFFIDSISKTNGSGDNP